MARQHGGNRVGIMHDADGPGDEGATGTLWRMHESGVDRHLVWSRRKFGGKYADRQAESVTADDWSEIAQSIDTRETRS